MYNLFARASETCIINGRYADPSECDRIGKAFIGLFGGFFIVLFAVLLGLFVWWIITLVHVLTHEDVPNRVVWIVLHFVGAPLLASPIYYFAVQRPYEKAKKPTSNTKPAKKKP